MTLALQGASLVLSGNTLLAPTSHVFTQGRVTAVLGPNGAGKSSLLSLASGLRKPASGRVLLDGAGLDTMAPATLARRRAVMSQETAVVFDFTVRDVVALGRYPHRLQPSPDEEGVIEAAIEAADVSALQDRIYNTLSGGEKARAQLARALAQIWLPPAEGGARWLLLDEPTAALDLSHQHQVMARARAWAHGQNVGVIAVLHDLNLALRYADDVLVVSGGQCVAAGPVAQVLTREMVEQVWRVSCHTSQAPDGTLQYLFGNASPEAALSRSAVPA